eukprot:431491-Prymnesium_polylepis.1
MWAHVAGPSDRQGRATSKRSRTRAARQRRAGVVRRLVMVFENVGWDGWDELCAWVPAPHRAVTAAAGGDGFGAWHIIAEGGGRGEADAVLSIPPEERPALVSERDEGRRREGTRAPSPAGGSVADTSRLPLTAPQAQ